LNFTCIEYQLLRTQVLYEQGKNALKKLYLQKGILLLDSGIELLKLQVWQSRLLFSEINQSTRTEIYFIPKLKGLGIDNMGEFAVSLKLSDQFVNERGKPATFIDISKALTDARNI